MCPASASRASEPETNAPTTSTTRIALEMASTNASGRRWPWTGSAWSWSWLTSSSQGDDSRPDQRRTELGALVPDFVAPPGRVQETGVPERRQVGGDTSRAEPGHRRERGGGQRSIQVRQDLRAAVAQEPAERLGGRLRRTPEVGD